MLNVFKIGDTITGTEDNKYAITDKNGIFKVIDLHIYYETCTACNYRDNTCKEAKLMNIKTKQHKKEIWIDDCFLAVNCDQAFKIYNEDTRTELSKLINKVYLKEREELKK